MFLSEILSNIDSGGSEFIEREYDFGRIVGSTSCVETTDRGEIVFSRFDRIAKRVRDLLRIVTQNHAVVWRLSLWGKSELYYVLMTAFVGHRLGLEPWDLRAAGGDYGSWRTHALTYDGQGLEPETETTKCP